MRPIFLALAYGLATCGVALADDWFAHNESGLLDLYRHLHSHPELSYHEAETSKRIAEELRKAGAEVMTGVGKTGVVGVLKNGEGPTVLVRTDLDALPVIEQTGLPFASKATTTDDEGKTVGVMHACGHDVHMTCLVGTARWLADHRDRWKGTVVLVGQPAEEKIGGAKMMLADGLYTRFPKPDYALALHVADDLETGKVAYTRGPAMAQRRRRSTSSYAARAVMGRGPTRRSTRSCWPPPSCWTSRRSSAGRSARSTPRSSPSARSTAARSTTSSPPRSASSSRSARTTPRSAP